MKSGNTNSNQRDANPDPITSEAGAHPVGTGIGAVAGGAAGVAAGAAAAGAATGAATGTVAGPIGMGIGAVAGAVIGGLAGKAGGEAVNPTGEGRSGNAPMSADLERFIDYTVVDQQDSKIGTVDSVWQDSDGQPAYVSVRTGWLGMGKSHVVPVRSANVNNRDRVIRLPFSLDQVRNAPSFESTSDLDDAAEDTIARYYETHGFRPYERARAATAAPELDTTTEAVNRNRPARQTSEEQRVQLKEESVKVGKREVEYGGVRLRKVVRTEVVNQPVELTREEIVIERVPASGAQTSVGAVGSDFTEEELYVPLRREEAVIAKETRVTGEVRVGKRRETESQTVSETIRKEDVEIEEQGASESRLNAKGDRAAGVGKYEPKERSRQG